MNTQTRTEKIEDAINREVAGSVPALATPQTAVFVPGNMGQLMEFAKLMSTARGAIPPFLVGEPGNCLAVATQAYRWQMDPFAVANKCYFVNDRLAYESQLVNAICNTRAPIKQRPSIHFEGEGEELVCNVEATFVDENTPRIVTQKIKTIPENARKSPLWKHSPEQQLAYYTTRLWVRRHCPEVLMGIYTREEIADLEPQPDGTYIVPEIEPVLENYEEKAAGPSFVGVDYAGKDDDRTVELDTTQIQEKPQPERAQAAEMEIKPELQPVASSEPEPQAELAIGEAPVVAEAEAEAAETSATADDGSFDEDTFISEIEFDLIQCKTGADVIQLREMHDDEFDILKMLSPERHAALITKFDDAEANFDLQQGA